jgi:hypothetical protein
MEVYVVVQEGVYRHAIHGVFSTLEKAKECAYISCKDDKDDYHTYDIYKGVLDQKVEDLVREGVYYRYDYQRDKDGIMRQRVKLETPEIEYK